ncbi:hypothetical protein HU200_014374 [Digitaria exilis]|uniref:Uncharacterized protein n=1 Tax=Digitaria exilis TaxID=1010633 RepID=A0A835FBQ0_9POAL|nr:hypothetical protein HU200_014374 [Digitaria exilis]
MELHDDSNVMEPPAKKCTFHGPTLSECLGKEGLEKLRAADLNLKHLAVTRVGLDAHRNISTPPVQDHISKGVEEGKYVCSEHRKRYRYMNIRRAMHACSVVTSLVVLSTGKQLLEFAKEPVEHGRGKTSKVVSVLDITTSFFAAVCGLLNLQKEEDPDILFLFETKMDLKRIEGLRWKIGMTNLVVKNCKGKSGGLAIFSFV